MPEDTIIQFYKLTIDKLQLMLINVLLYQFSNTKVSQGSVATRLRCNGILDDQFIIQSLLSLSEKNLKIGQRLPKLWAIKFPVVFFLWNTVYVACDPPTYDLFAVAIFSLLQEG